MSTEEGASGINEYDLFINGSFQDSTGDSLPVSYPYNGETWARVPNGSSEDVDRAVNAARGAFENEWKESLPSRRRDVLQQIADTIRRHSDELGELETRQNGKLVVEMKAQTLSLPGYYEYFAGLADQIEGRSVPIENKGGDMFNYTRREPLGVVGAITPWNSPLLLTSAKLAPALATGNTFVHKPSEHTPVSALRLAELIASETDLPEGVYNVVTGDGETGASLADHSDLDKLAFTGSTRVGREVGAKAGRSLIKVSLELGGKSPNILFSDADLNNAVNGVIKGIFAATGQTCLAGSRVFVHDEIYDEFLDQFTDRASKVKLGDPMDPETEMGPVAFRGQWEKVKKYVELAEEEGASVASGGFRPEGLPGECFIRPTVLTDVENEMRVAQEEIFGPVASVLKFSREEEVIRRANDTSYGLAAGVWTEDMRRAIRVSDRLEAGTIWINEYRTMNYRAPFGGYKDSGLGREGGPEVLDEYLQTKSVFMDLSGKVSDPFKMGV